MLVPKGELLTSWAVKRAPRQPKRAKPCCSLLCFFLLFLSISLVFVFPFPDLSCEDSPVKLHLPRCGRSHAMRVRRPRRGTSYCRRQAFCRPSAGGVPLICRRERPWRSYRRRRGGGSRGGRPGGVDGNDKSLHSDVQDYLRSDVDVTLFLRHLQKVVDDRRYTELEVEFGSRLKFPDFKIRAPILKQASEVYSDMIFQLFQEEYEEFQAAYILNRDESGPCREYIVAILEKERQYKVHGNPSDQTVSCSCRKFETLGFLCSHALKILDTMDIKYLPDRYILKRWKKHARCLTAPQVVDRKVQEDTTLEFSSRYQYLSPIYAKLVARASECEESYRLLEQGSVELVKKVEEILQKQTSIDASEAQSDVEDIQVSSSANVTDNESEQALDHLSSSRVKRRKKKGRKGKNHTTSGIKKGLPIKKPLQPEQRPVQFPMLDAPTQPGNILFQGGGLSNLFPVEQLSFNEMQRDLNPSFPSASRELDFTMYHAPEPSSNGEHNQQGR